VDGIVTFTSTVTFSEPVNATHLEANLDELIADLGEDPWPDDGCASALTQNQVFDESDPPELLCEKLVGATKARYRFGPPVDYTRSTWEMEWDLVFASTEWWTWFDAGATGTEPTPGPSLVSHQSWVWDSEAEWSDWYEIPLPTEPGETRVVNVLTTCWKSTRIGTKPTASGPEVALPE
jgi:hypothetical protein